MNYLNFDQVSGHRVSLLRTDPRHFNVNGQAGYSADNDTGAEGFQKMMFEALEGVNKLQNESADVSKKMIIDPESVDPHDVTIAMAKANTALALTKAVVDKGLRAYKEIISIR